MIDNIVAEHHVVLSLFLSFFSCIHPSIAIALFAFQHFIWQSISQNQISQVLAHVSTEKKCKRTINKFSV